MSVDVSLRSEKRISVYCTVIVENVHTVDISSNTYIPCLVNVVSECSLILFNLRIIKFFNQSAGP